MLPYRDRLATWQRFGHRFSVFKLDRIAVRTVSLDEVRGAATDMLEGRPSGRVLVDINGLLMA